MIQTTKKKTYMNDITNIINRFKIYLFEKKFMLWRTLWYWKKINKFNNFDDQNLIKIISHSFNSNLIFFFKFIY